MRLGICNELFEGWDLAQTCEMARSIGYDGIELAPFTLAPRIGDLSPAQRRDIRRTIADAGLATIGLHWLLAKTDGFHLTDPDAKVRRATGDYLVELAEATSELGGSLMVFGSPKQRSLREGVSHAQATDWATEVFARSMPKISACGINLCLEPLAPSETDFVNSIGEALALLARVDHPNLRLHLDVKAMSADPGGSITSLIAKHGRIAGHVHVQDPVNLRGPGMGELDFGPVARALVESGYQGWVSVETFDFSPGAERTARESFACLTQALADAFAPSDERSFKTE